MDKKKAICEYLRKNHVGKEKAIHSKELEKLLKQIIDYSKASFALKQEYYKNLEESEL